MRRLYPLRWKIGFAPECGLSSRRLEAAANVRFRSRLCENSDAELARRKFVSITLNNKRTALTVTVEIRKERKQFCALIGQDAHIGYVFRDGNWWAWFDHEWLGYFPARLWKTVFSTSELVQWFGEVATFNGVPPQSQMGNGILPTQPTAAHMEELCDVDAVAWACRVRNEQQLSKLAAPKFYGVLQAGYGDVRYGGPGK
jgi:hypothetical protein